MQFVSSITVKNFKSIKSATFRLEKYTPIVGQNNAGKSNCIAALKWLLQKEKLNEQCFNDTELSVEVEGVIDGINEEILGKIGESHIGKIRDFIAEKRIRIKRIQEQPNASAAQQQLIIFHPVEQVWKTNPTGIENAIKAMFPEAIEVGAMVDAADDVSKFKKSNTIGRLVSIVRLGFCMNNFLVLLTLRVRLTGLHS